MNRSDKPEKLIPAHGGYRKLKSFQVAQLVYDVTVRFCDRYVEKNSRTHDQMVQAARSGVQNIAEGSQDSGTSKKIELKLTNIARGSLEELKLDYEDFLRHRNLPLWPRADQRRQGLIDRRPQTADDFADWVRAVKGGFGGQSGRGEQSKKQYGEKRRPAVNDDLSFTGSTQSTTSTISYQEIAANGALVLITVACSLLDRQISALEKAFIEEGGFTERLYRVRKNNRKY